MYKSELCIPSLNWNEKKIKKIKPDFCWIIRDPAINNTSQLDLENASTSILIESVRITVQGHHRPPVILCSSHGRSHPGSVLVLIWHRSDSVSLRWSTGLDNHLHAPKVLKWVIETAPTEIFVLEILWDFGVLKDVEHIQWWNSAKHMRSPRGPSPRECAVFQSFVCAR